MSRHTRLLRYVALHNGTAACALTEDLQVFYWVGYNGIAYTLDVFIADTSSLKNRAWLFAFSTCPYIANTFAGPAAANRFLKHSTLRWGFGAFAIITPIICAPVVIIFLVNRRKAVAHGYVPKQRSGRTVWQSIVHYAIEFDCEFLSCSPRTHDLWLTAQSGRYDPHRRRIRAVPAPI